MHKLVVAIIIAFFSLASSNTYGQCDQAFIKNCFASGGEAKYVKHFRIRFSEAKNTKTRSEGMFTLMMSKGNHYRFMICNDPSKPGATNKEYKAFDFVCSKTGPYYIRMFFKDGKEGCGVCILTLITD